MKKIKFILLVFVALFAGVNGVRAQVAGHVGEGTYMLTVEIRTVDLDNLLEFRVSKREFTPLVFFDWGHFRPMDFTIPGAATHEISVAERQGHPIDINFFSRGLGGSSHQGLYVIDPNPPYIIDHDIINDGIRPGVPGQRWPLLAANSSFRISLLPTKFNFFERDSNDEITAAPLIFDHPVTIRASVGFSPAAYNWQYSLDGQRTWRDIPAPLQHRDVLNLRGMDLFPTELDFRNFLRNEGTISIQINTPTYNTTVRGLDTARVVLTPMLSSPRIQDVLVQHETIHGANDASATVIFDRPLYDGEILRVWINNRLEEGAPHANITALGPGNSITIDSLSPGEVIFAVTGIYNGNDTYSGSDGHRRPYYIQAQTRVEPTITHSGISCFGRNDGQITVTAVGGTGDYFATLFIRNGNNLDSLRVERFTYTGRAEFSGLSPGEYEVRVIDSNGGGQANSKLIDEPEQLEATVTGEIPPPSYGLREGWVQLRVSGGTGTYTATISGDLSTHYPIDNGSIFEFSELAAGTYTVTVRDANGCTFDLSFTLTALINHEITHSQHVSCYGGRDGQITVRAFGGTGDFTARLYERPLWGDDTFWGYRTFLQSDSAVFSGLTYGTYVVRVVDTAGVYSEDGGIIYTITQPSELDVSVPLFEKRMPDSYTSNTGRVVVRVSEGTPNETGGHRYTVRLFHINRENYILPVSENDEGNGVFSYTFTDLFAGSYRVIVEDAGECGAVRYFTLTSYITHEIYSIRPVSCFDGSDGQIIVRAMGGSGNFIAELFRYGTLWDDIEFSQTNNGVFNNLTAGYYRVTVRDTEWRDSQDTNVSDTITQPAQLTVAVPTHTQPLAHESQDGTITVRVGGGTKNAQGGYGVTLAHSDGRSFSPASHLVEGDYVLYTFTGLGRGNYTISVEDRNECPASLPFTLNAPPPLFVTIEEMSSISWYGAAQGELLARATGGVPFESNMPYTFTWYREVNGVMQPLTIPNDSIAGNLLAGRYQVRITDANGISRTSEAHYLEEPSLIEVKFIVVAPDCYGTRGGSITANVIGGFPPFRFEWCVEGATGNQLTSLEAGTYRLVVTDSRGGRNRIDNSLVTVPPAGNLIFNSQVVQPTCLAPEGSVTLTLSGAEPPFSVRWLDRDEVLTVAPNETITRSGLISGTYTVQVTDSSGCRNVFSFHIVPVPEFTVSIGNDLVMNRNQSRTVEAISDEPNLTYLWYFNDTRLPDTESSILVDRAGYFTVIVTNPQGCTATDRINVRMTNYVLDLDMTAPTKVEVGSEVHAVNLSTMAADRIEWIVPDETTIIEQSDTRLVFKFNQTGRHTISMEGFRGEGATIVTQTIEVVGVGEVTLPDGEDSLIRQFWASPSPSTGEFRVLVELNRPGDFTMRLYSPDGVLMDTREGRNVESQTFDYEIAGVLQGTFVLHLITNVDKSVLQIVIQR